MNVLIFEGDMDIALLNWVPEGGNAQINALDVVDDNDAKLQFEFIKSR